MSALSNDLLSEHATDEAIAKGSMEVSCALDAYSVRRCYRCESVEGFVGFRVIDRYRNVWALPRGRILKHEYPENAVRRVLAEIGVRAKIRRDYIRMEA
jgi:8-oxo-dGTP pyrophosphatase MutT (NUDIX family)